MGAENLVPTGIRSPNFSARNESLYRLRCLLTSSGFIKLLYEIFMSHFFSVPHLSHSHLCNGPNNIWGRTQTCEEHLYDNLLHHLLLLVFLGEITLTAHFSDSLTIITLRKKDQCLDILTATEFYHVFSGRQPYQDTETFRRFGNSLRFRNVGKVLIS